MNNLSANDISIMSSITSSDLGTKMILLILFIISVYSWSIMVNKSLMFRKLKKNMNNFDSIFWSGQILDSLYEKINNNVDNPLAAVFVGAMNECKKAKNGKKSDVIKLGQKDRLLQTMYNIRNNEMHNLEKGISLLGTAGSISPFIGLLGTVWGIMHSFQSIALAKNINISVVAPGIAEALFVTAVGLFVAIPAVVFYNHCVSQTDYIYNRLEDFINELNILLSRAIDDEQL